MLGREKMNGSEMRALWGSRIVIWITIILVLFPVVWIVMSSFSAGDSFFLSSLFPEKFSVEHYVTLFRETDFTVWVWNSLKFCVIVATIQLVITSGGICIRETAFYREKIWTHVAAGAAGISQQYGSGRLLYSDL